MVFSKKSFTVNFWIKNSSNWTYSLATDLNSCEMLIKSYMHLLYMYVYKDGCQNVWSRSRTNLVTFLPISTTLLYKLNVLSLLLSYICVRLCAGLSSVHKTCAFQRESSLRPGGDSPPLRGFPDQVGPSSRNLRQVCCMPDSEHLGF